MTLGQVWKKQGWRGVIDSISHRLPLPTRMQDRVCDWFEQHLRGEAHATHKAARRTHR